MFCAPLLPIMSLQNRTGSDIKIKIRHVGIRGTQIFSNSSSSGLKLGDLVKKWAMHNPALQPYKS